MDNRPQQLGDFEILRELGRGGMGVVYEAKQKSLNRRVALKVLSTGLGLSTKAILRFKREAEAAAKLHHTNIVPVYFTGEEDRIPYYVMELVDGPALDRVIRWLRADRAGDQPVKQTEGSSEGGAAFDSDASAAATALYGKATPNSEDSTSSESSTLSGGGSFGSGTAYFDNVARLMADVADALGHAHEHGVVHRDIKPSNLLLSSDGRLSVNDFGLARLLEQPGMTVSGEFVGSPLYMSPEQITAGRAPLDHRTDIYSLGATLYELLTLQPPFPGKHRDEVIAQILHKEAKPPRRLNKKIPLDLETICLKAIHKDPDRRYQSAGELARDLRAYVSRHAISAKRIGPIGKCLKWVRRRPTAAALIAVVCLSLVTFALLFERNRRNQRDDALARGFIHAMGLDFERAEEELNRAEQLGASEGRLELLRGQINIYQGEYSDARENLRNARDKIVRHSIRIAALLAIAEFYAGEEGTYFEELEWLYEEKPQTQEDYIFLALAFSWGDPHTAEKLLDDASQFGTPDLLYYAVRAGVEQLLAMDVPDSKRALAYAEKAVDNAGLAHTIVRDSPHTLTLLLEAHTVAAARCLELGDSSGYRAHLLDAKLVAERLSEFSDSWAANHARVNFLQQTGRKDEADKFLNSIPPDKLGNYLAGYRVISRFGTGEHELAQEEFELLSESQGAYQASFRLFNLLGQEPNDADRERMRTEFGRYVVGKMASRTHWAIGNDWAVLKLLKDEERAEEVAVFIEELSRQFKIPFLRDFVPISRGMRKLIPPDELIKECNDSRRSIGTAYFVLGINALCDGDRTQAIECFKQCEAKGFYYFYDYQWCLALLKKLNRDPTWPVWIDGDDGNDQIYQQRGQTQQNE